MQVAENQLHVSLVKQRTTNKVVAMCGNQDDGGFKDDGGALNNPCNAPTFSKVHMCGMKLGLKLKIMRMQVSEDIE
jgi:hypothetical protein